MLWPSGWSANASYNWRDSARGCPAALSRLQSSAAQQQRVAAGPAGRRVAASKHAGDAIFQPFAFRQMLDHHCARPERWWRIPEKSRQHAILVALDVDLQRVDTRHAGLLEDTLQPQRGYPDRPARDVAGDDMAGAEIVAVGLDHQLAVGRAGGRRHQFDLRVASRGVVESQPRMGDR